MSAMTADTVLVLDVDNTLLDNDRVIADMRRHLHAQFGAAADGYWTAFEVLRAELGYADYLGALQRFRAGFEHDPGSAHRLLSVSGFLIDYPLAERLYPKELAVVARLGTLDTTAILSDSATSSSSRARCSARGCGTRWTAACRPTFTRSACSRRCSAASRRAVTW